MSRVVTVYQYTDPDERTVLGRAWLMPSGAAEIDGFTPAQAEHYRTVGIRDFVHDEIVPISDGEKFLDVLYFDHQRGYVRAEETDE